MSVFTNVYNVWRSLEDSYAGSEITKTEYCKKLILWDSGEAGFRSLTEKIMADSSDAPEGQLSELMGWIRNLRSNLQKCETLGVPVTDLEEMKGEGVDIVASFNVLPKDTVLPLTEARGKGLLPTYFVVDGRIERQVMDGVEVACIDNTELLETVTSMRNQDSDNPVLRGIARYIHERDIETPFVVMSYPKVMELSERCEVEDLEKPASFETYDFRLFREQTAGVQIMSYEEKYE